MPLESGRDPISDAEAVVGQQEATPKLVSWIQKIERSAESDGQIQITLYITSKAGGQTSIWQTSHVQGDAEPSALAKEILDAAENEALENQGKTKFAVGAAGIMQRCIFTLMTPVRDMGDEDDEDYHLEDLELPNKRGMYAQQMRHIEIMTKELVVATKTGRRDLLEENRELREENRGLKRQLMDNLRTFQEIHNMQFARDMQFRKLEKDEARKDEAVKIFGQGVSMFGPGLAQKFLGGGQPGAAGPQQTQAGFASPNGGQPGAPPPQQAPFQHRTDPRVGDVGQLLELENVMIMLFESMDVPQLQAVAGTLKPMQQGMLARIHEILNDRHQAKEAAAARAAQQSQPENGAAPSPPIGYGYTGAPQAP